MEISICEYPMEKFLFHNNTHAYFNIITNSIM